MMGEQAHPCRVVQNIYDELVVTAQFSPDSMDARRGHVDDKSLTKPSPPFVFMRTSPRDARRKSHRTKGLRVFFSSGFRELFGADFGVHVRNNRGKAANRDGVVFKRSDAVYTMDHPNSGGSQLKLKFTESASFIVTAVNAKRTVTLIGEQVVPVGNVTIPPNY